MNIPKTAQDVTTEWLQSLDFRIQPANQATIQGVIVRDLTVHLDGRGEVTELWSSAWAKDGVERVEHVYQSATDVGVVKCWHLHQIHTDHFTVTRGKLQVCIADLRTESPTFGHVNRIFLGSLRPRLIKIPPRLLHGWKALSAPEVLVVNGQTHVYDAKDEFKFPWDCVLQEVWEPLNG